MSTIATNGRVTQLQEEAQAKAEEAADLFARLTPRQAATTTEIGWTVAATAWHLSFGARLTTAQIKQLKRNKVQRVPRWAVDLINRVTIPLHRRTPHAVSAARLRAATAESVALLAEWADDDLTTRIEPPDNGATTYDEALRISFIGHFDEHLGQVRRALALQQKDSSPPVGIEPL